MEQYYVPDFEVKIQGLTMEADVKHAVTNLSYDNNLEQADMFNITLDNSDLRFSDSALFDVGKEVEIHIGYVNNLKPMMLGEITAVQPNFPEGGAPTISITGYDKSHRMRHNQKNRQFKFTNASLIAAQIAAENLLIPVVDPTPVLIEDKNQRCSDMKLLKELAKKTFFETYVRWDKLYFRLPRPQTEAVVLEWGKNLSSFSPRLSTSGQIGLLKVRDYDQNLAQTIVGLVPVIATDFDLDNIIERLGSTIVDQLKSFGEKCISGETISSFPDALTFAKALLQEILEGLFEGNGSCIGIPELKAGDMVEVRGLGKRFSGKYRLRRVTHTLGSSGYRTNFEVTQRSSSSMIQLVRKALGEEKPLTTVIGKVINNIDPKGLGRVQVRYPWLSETVISPWAKVVQPDSSTYFMPDVGDDVTVTFDKGDFDRPMVTGTLWNVKKKPVEVPTYTNFKKVIQSPKLGHKIIIDDDPDAGGITLESAAGAKIVLDNKSNISIKSKLDVNINDGNNGAARKEDKIKSTNVEDSAFWNWLSGFINVLNAWSPIPTDGGAALKTALTTYLTANPVPTQLTGKIIEGSSSVKIGD